MAAAGTGLDLADMFADDSDMMLESHRLSTFKNWPFDRENCNCTSAKMAEAGFYHCPTRNEPDLVRCFVCQFELDGWEPKDDPWREHQRHTIEKKGRKCKFMELAAVEKDMTVDQFLVLLKERCINKVRILMNRNVQKFDNETEQMREELTMLATEK